MRTSFVLPEPSTTHRCFSPTTKTRTDKSLTDQTHIQRFRARLEDERQALLAEDVDAAEDRGTVTLDQQSVGRLSRMDAMQRQAMAQATSRRRASRLARIEAALARIDDGEFGYCQDCGEEIAAARLDLDPTVPSCVSCANG